MNVFQRILISITRNLKKSLLLVMISFVLGLFVVSSIYIYLSLNTIDSSVKEQLSPSILISAKDDYELDGDIWIDLIDEESTNPIFHKYLSDERVKYGDLLYNQYTSASNPTLKSLPLLIGVNRTEFVDVLNGEFDNLRGRLFTQEEMNDGKNVIVLIENLKYGPHYEVGDKIQYTFNKLTSYLDEEPTAILTEEFEIVGVLELEGNEEDDYANHTLNTMNAADQAYIPYHTLESIMTKLRNWEMDRVSKLNEDSHEYGFDIRTGNIQFWRACYKLNSADDLEGFVEELENDLSDYPIFEIQSDVSNYKDVQSSTQRLGKISLMVLIISVVGSLMILTLIIYICMKDRENEVGLLLALGEKKNNILICFVIEILVLCSIGVILSFIFGNNISSFVIDKFILNQEIIGQYSQTIINANMFNQYLLYALSLETIILVLSSTYPLLKIMKTNPKNLLQ